MEIWDTLLKLLMIASIPALVIIACLMMGYGDFEHALLSDSCEEEDQSSRRND